MTRQVTEGSPITVTVRSATTGGFVPDAPLDIDGDVYADPDCTETFDEHRANGAGEFVFYATPGTVITVTSSDPDAAGIEPIQVVGVAARPGGLAAVHPDDTPQVIEDSPLSEHVTDSSLVGAVHPDDALPEDQGGAAAMVGVNEAQNVPPGPTADESTPDGTTATDRDSVAPPSEQDTQVTPQVEQVPTDGQVEPAPDTVEPAPESSAGTAKPAG